MCYGLKGSHCSCQSPSKHPTSMNHQATIGIHIWIPTGIRINFWNFYLIVGKWIAFYYLQQSHSYHSSHLTASPCHWNKPSENEINTMHQHVVTAISKTPWRAFKIKISRFNAIKVVSDLAFSYGILSYTGRRYYKTCLHQSPQVNKL